jgi:hypothetical protein
MTHATPLSERHGPSPSAGYSVHELMGLDMNPAAEHPRFDDDIWDLTGVLGAPIQLKPQRLVWDFTAIPHSRWQVIVREFLVRAPRHDAVATLPGHAGSNCRFGRAPIGGSMSLRGCGGWPARVSSA